MASASDALLRCATYYMQVLTNASRLCEAGSKPRSLGLTLFDSEWENISHARTLLIEKMLALESATKSITDSADRLKAVTKWAPFKFLVLKHISFGTLLIEMRRPPSDHLAWLEPLLLGDTAWLPQVRMEILTKVGRAYDRQSQNRRAIECFQEALTLARQCNERKVEAEVLSDLGSATAAIGNYNTAIILQEQSLLIMRELGNRNGESQVLMCLGMELSSLGDHHRAVEYYEQALSIDRSIKDHQHEGRVMSALGIAQASLGGNRGDYLMSYQNALEIALQNGHRADETSALMGLAILSDDPTYLEKAIINCRDLRRRRALLPLGDLCCDRGDHRRAIECYSTALEVARERSDNSELTEVLLRLADTHKSLGEDQKAAEYLEEALPVSRKLSNRVSESGVLHRLADTYDKLGRSEAAVRFCEQALTICLEMPDGTHATQALSEWLESCDKALGLEPHDTKAMAKKGLLLSLLAQPERGLAYVDRSISINGTDPDAFYFKGIILAKALGKYSDAEESFAEARRLGLLDADGCISRFWQRLGEQGR